LQHRKNDIVKSWGYINCAAS